jgi:hypothetical protein
VKSAIFIRKTATKKQNIEDKINYLFKIYEKRAINKLKSNKELNMVRKQHVYRT